MRVPATEILSHHLNRKLTFMFRYLWINFLNFMDESSGVKRADSVRLTL